MQAPPYSCHVMLWMQRDWLIGARGAVGCRPEEAEGRGRGKLVRPGRRVLVLEWVILCTPDCPDPRLRNEEARLGADSSLDSILSPLSLPRMASGS